MPILIVYGVGECTRQKNKDSFELGLRKAAASVKELGLNEDQVTCFFPGDVVHPHRGGEVIIFVDGLFKKPGRTAKVRKRLAEKLVKVVFEHLLDADFAECFVRPFSPDSGFATNRE